MVIRIILLLFLLNAVTERVSAQSNSCTFKPPFFTMHFGKGNVQDINITSLTLYNRVSSSCPTDGHYAFISSTSDCFYGDWHTLAEDHTPSDAEGNMLVVNSAYDGGVFLTTKVKGFKGGATYQIGLWLLNVCKPTNKCPYPLLPNLSIQLQTPSGKIVGKFGTGELPRRDAPHWTQYKAQFSLPPAETELTITMTNNAPGGCGNDFALDDITFSECVKPEPIRTIEVKKSPPAVVKKDPVIMKKEAKKPVPPLVVNRTTSVITVPKDKSEVPVINKATVKPQPVVFVPPPPVLQQRATSLIRQIETEEGEIRLDLYDNGEIDGDTVSIYHNNVLVVSGQQLSQKPITFRIKVDKTQPHHELVMVAENLGSIPPNTSLMIVTAKDKRYQVFISSTEQQNAKVVIDLKE